MRRILPWLGGAALLVAGVAFVLWSNSTPAPETAPRQAAATPLTAPSPTAPPAPAPPVPAPPPVAVVPPSFDIVKVDPSGHAVIAGRAAPGAKVAVLDGDKKLGEVTADARGEWVLVPANPMAPGERQLTLEATDPASGAKTKSTDTVALAIAPAIPGTPGSGTVAVLLPGNGSQPAQALQVPNARGGSLSLDTAEYGDTDKLMLSGHATPGAMLRLYAENQLVGTVTADANGKWSLVSPHPKAAGKIELRIDELAADGSVAQRVAEPFEPQTAAAASTGSYTVQAGNSLWVIARKAYGNGTQYTVIFGANKEHIRDPNLIYPGQIITLPKS
jgi:nucleoid-associated protein YgaU